MQYFFREWSLGVVGHYAGGKISTCCLVSVPIHPDCPRMAIKLVVVFFLKLSQKLFYCSILESQCSF